MPHPRIAAEGDPRWIRFEDLEGFDVIDERRKIAMTDLAPVYNTKTVCPCCDKEFPYGKVRSKMVRYTVSVDVA